MTNLTDSAPVRECEPSLFRLFVADFIRSRVALLGLVVFTIIILATVFAPLITPQDPYDLMQLDIMDGRLPPGSSNFDGSTTYILGTDDQGRDMFSGILYGLRTSLIVGVGSALLAALVGTLLGLVAAYVGGRFETFVMRLVDLQLSFPTILTALMILAVLGKSVLNVVLALVIVEWATYAHTARAAALAERRRDYIVATETLAIPFLEDTAAAPLTQLPAVPDRGRHHPDCKRHRS